jgi:hypothetical protein
MKATSVVAIIIITTTKSKYTLTIITVVGSVLFEKYVLIMLGKLANL